MPAPVRAVPAPGGGARLDAAQPFARFALIVPEATLLEVPQLRPSNPLFKPLQAYFTEHLVPASIVLKLLAFVLARPATQEAVLQCFCPDPAAFAAAPVVQQAQRFARTLLEHPPVPELAEWAAQQQPPAQAQAAHDAALQPAEAAVAPAQQQAQQEQQEQQEQEPHPQQAALDLLARVGLIWSCHGRNLKSGSALLKWGPRLAHTCCKPNTAYRTAAGVIAPVRDPDGMSIATDRAPPVALPPSSAGTDAASAPVGLHQALTPIQPDEELTTSLVGLGHQRIMSTPARQRLLREKFLLNCSCERCTKQVDRARGIPCPACSTPHRAPDKLLAEDVALPLVQLDSFEAAFAAEAAGSAASSSSGASSGASSGTSSGASCGFIYCDYSELLAGAETPWACDTCGARFLDDTKALWGRFYERSQATIERDMEGFVTRLDDSLDAAPLIRDPNTLHERVRGIVCLLGPAHWAAWRVLLIGIELHCGALEVLTHKALKLSQQQPPAASEPGGAAAEQPAPRQPDAGARAAASRIALHVVRYAAALWRNVSRGFGPDEAGMALGYHFTEAVQVLLQVAACPGLLPEATGEQLVGAALTLQRLVLPGMRQLAGPDYNPLAQLLGDACAGGAAPGAAAVAASVRRQMLDASGVKSLVEELRSLEARERSGAGGGGEAAK